MAAAQSSKLQRKQTVAAQAAHGAADMTRRMVCGGLAGMIAKVRHETLDFRWTNLTRNETRVRKSIVCCIGMRVFCTFDQL
jgi:hypothetical protein